jgi:hypothetical protein
MLAIDRLPVIDPVLELCSLTQGHIDDFPFVGGHPRLLAFLPAAFHKKQRQLVITLKPLLGSFP